MRRGRVQLKRIENKINREVTFSKRRTGLLKKAHEISVLCDAEVALIVFSSKGKLSEYATDSCMEKILDQHDRMKYPENQLISNDNEAQVNWYVEHAKIKDRMEFLEKNHRHLTGQDLDSLNFKELRSIEKQLDSALRSTRSRKNELMYQSISELQKQDKALREKNNFLAEKIKKKGQPLTQEAEMEQQNNGPKLSLIDLLQPMQLL